MCTPGCCDHQPPAQNAQWLLELLEWRADLNATLAASTLCRVFDAVVRDSVCKSQCKLPGSSCRLPGSYLLDFWAPHPTPAAVHGQPVHGQRRSTPITVQYAVYPPPVYQSDAVLGAFDRSWPGRRGPIRFPSNLDVDQQHSTVQREHLLSWLPYR